VENENPSTARNDQPCFDHGPKHDFRKVTVTLPPPIYELLVKECARRKVEGRRNHLISSLVREAVAKYFDHEFAR
jgi:transcriptional regulator of met regulon